MGGGENISDKWCACWCWELLLSSIIIITIIIGVYLFIWSPTVAQHLCASAGKKTGFGALRKCKSDASDVSDASDASYIQSQCVWGGVWGGGVIRCIGRIGF